MSIGLLLLSEVLQQCSLAFIDPFLYDYEPVVKNSQLHRNRDFRDHFLRFRDIRDQVFKTGSLGDLRDQVAALVDRWFACLQTVTHHSTEHCVEPTTS